MSPSIWQLLIVVVLIMLLFGAGRLPRVMEDLAKGIKSFKHGLKDEDEPKQALENEKAESKKE